MCFLPQDCCECKFAYSATPRAHQLPRAPAVVSHVLPFSFADPRLFYLPFLFRLAQIAGTLGTGLFLTSGKSLRQAGPLGALLAYVLVGTVAYSCVHCSCFFSCQRLRFRETGRYALSAK